MAKSDPTMLRVSSTLLQELINENIMLKIIADRRNYVSSLTKVSLFVSHDTVIVGWKRNAKAQRM